MQVRQVSTLTWHKNTEEEQVKWHPNAGWRTSLPTPDPTGWHTPNTFYFVYILNFIIPFIYYFIHPVLYLCISLFQYLLFFCHFMLICWSISMLDYYLFQFTSLPAKDTPPYHYHYHHHHHQVIATLWCRTVILILQFSMSRWDH